MNKNRVEMTLGFYCIGETMEFLDVLRKKNMKVREFKRWGIYFRKRWEDYFANHLSDEEKKIFSFTEISIHVVIYGTYLVMRKRSV